MTRLEPGIAVRHIDGRIGLVLETNDAAKPPLAKVRFMGEDFVMPQGYLERIGSKDMD